MTAIRRAGALRIRARSAVHSYHFARARALLVEAQAALDSAPDQHAHDVVRMRVLLLITLGYVEAEVDSLAAGLRALNRTEPLLGLLPPGPERDALTGHVLQQRALLHIRGGDPETGIELRHQAAPLLEASLAAGVGDPYVLASLYLNTGAAEIELSRTSSAVAELRTCIALCEQHGLDGVAVKARHNLGWVAHMTGDVPTALRYFAETVRHFRETGSSAGLAIVMLDQARALLAGGLADEAARQLDEALPTLRRKRVGQDAAEAEMARAAADLLNGDPIQARRRANRSQRMFLRRGNERWAAVAALAALRAETVAALSRRRVGKGLPVTAVKLADQLRGLMLEDEAALALMLAVRLEVRRGERVAAGLLLEQVPRPRATTPIDHRMLLRLCRAELAVAGGDVRRALGEARRGLIELGRVRDRVGGLELVCGTAVHGEELGELAVRLVLESRRPDPRRLFGWLERTRAQVYRYEPLPAIDDPSIAEKMTELRLARRSAQLARLGGRSVERMERRVAALQREAAREGWHVSPWGRPRPVAGLAEVTEALGDKALVAFATSGGGVVATVVAGGRVRLARLGSSAAAAEWAARLHADLDVLAPDTLPGPVAEVVRASAGRSAGGLDAQIVAPLLGLVGDRDLVVVPTGALYAVPWGSLPSLRGRPVVVAPSATAWLAAATAQYPSGRTVLARGPLLTGAVTEGGPLREVYPGAVDLEGPDATVSAVLAALDGAEVAHLAAHGEHEPTNALFSRLELADGPLFAYEVARLAQPPRQVVLAACELALNYVRPGDEALGYAGALLAGGVRTVVAATSRVGDTAAANAMADYHGRLARGVEPARALAESIADDPYRRPFICLGAG